MKFLEQTDVASNPCKDTEKDWENHSINSHDHKNNLGNGRIIGGCDLNDTKKLEEIPTCNNNILEGIIQDEENTLSTNTEHNNNTLSSKLFYFIGIKEHIQKEKNNCNTK